MPDHALNAFCCLLGASMSRRPLRAGNPKHGGEALVEAFVVGVVPAALEFVSLLRVELNRLHRASSRSGLGPFGGGDCCSFPAGLVGPFTSVSL